MEKIISAVFAVLIFASCAFGQSTLITYTVKPGDEANLIAWNYGMENYHALQDVNKNQTFAYPNGSIGKWDNPDRIEPGWVFIIPTDKINASKQAQYREILRTTSKNEARAILPLNANRAHVARFAHIHRSPHQLVKHGEKQRITTESRAAANRELLSLQQQISSSRAQLRDLQKQISTARSEKKRLESVRILITNPHEGENRRSRWPFWLMLLAILAVVAGIVYWLTQRNKRKSRFAAREPLAYHVGANRTDSTFFLYNASAHHMNDSISSIDELAKQIFAAVGMKWQWRNHITYEINRAIIALARENNKQYAPLTENERLGFEEILQDIERHGSQTMVE